MKQKKSILAVILSLIFSISFLSGNVFAYKESDLKKFLADDRGECENCDLSNANLKGIKKIQSFLLGSNLSGADLSGSDFSRSNLVGVNLIGANLRGTNLSKAYLTDANLTGANLTGTNLTGANLEGAIRTGDVVDSPEEIEEAKKEEERKKRLAKEKELAREIARKKKEEERKNSLAKQEGYKDIKFGMSFDEIRGTGACAAFGNAGGPVIYEMGENCYEIAGNKTSIYFYFDEGGLSVINIHIGKYRSALYKKLVGAIGKKYKEKYRLTKEQVRDNGGNRITYFENAKITLTQETNSYWGYDTIFLYYSYAEHPTFKKFASKISSDDF